MTTTQQRQSQLESRLVALQARMAEVTTQFSERDTKDWEDMATEREGDEVLEEMGQSAKIEIDQIDAALHRIAEGSYGICVTCGDQISPARLDLLPATPFCQGCAR